MRKGKKNKKIQKINNEKKRSCEEEKEPKNDNSQNAAPKIPNDEPNDEMKCKLEAHVIGPSSLKRRKKKRKYEECSTPPHKVKFISPSPVYLMLVDCICDDVPSFFVLGRKRFRMIDKDNVTPHYHLCKEYALVGVSTPKVMVMGGHIPYSSNELKASD
jgi:hypothetical protein